MCNVEYLLFVSIVFSLCTSSAKLPECLLMLLCYDIIANYKVNWVTSEWRPKRMAMTYIYISNGNRRNIDSATQKIKT